MCFGMLVRMESTLVRRQWVGAHRSDLKPFLCKPAARPAVAVMPTAVKSRRLW